MAYFSLERYTRVQQIHFVQACCSGAPPGTFGAMDAGIEYRHRILQNFHPFRYENNKEKINFYLPVSHGPTGSAGSITPLNSPIISKSNLITRLRGNVAQILYACHWNPV